MFIEKLEVLNRGLIAVDLPILIVARWFTDMFEAAILPGPAMTGQGYMENWVGNSCLGIPKNGCLILGQPHAYLETGGSTVDLSTVREDFE